MNETPNKKPKKQSVKKPDTQTSNEPEVKRTRSDRFLFTEQVIKQIKGLAAYGLTQKQICHILGISTDVFQLRSKEQPEIDAALWSGKSQAIANVSKVAYDMATSGKNSDMTKFFLKAKAGWRETERTELVGDENKPIVTENRTIDTSKLTIEEKRILLKGLRKQQEDGNKS